MYRQYLPTDSVSATYADLVGDLTEETWTTLQENIPEDITRREPLEFEAFAGVSAGELRRAANLG